MPAPPAPAPSPPAPRLLDQVLERVRYLHDSLRTEQANVHGIRAYVRFHGSRHPREMGKAEVERFLAWLSTERGVSVATHRQALCALLFLYQQVFGLSLPWMRDIGRPQVRRRLPVVLTVDEVRGVLTHLEGEHHQVLAQLLYGTGLRIAEALQLRVKDIDFDRLALVVRAGKGGKDRVVMLPATLVPALRAQLLRARVLWQADADTGRSGVQMPEAVDCKYPRVGHRRAWFWVFPQATPP